MQLSCRNYMGILLDKEKVADFLTRSPGQQPVSSAEQFLRCNYSLKIPCV